MIKLWLMTLSVICTLQVGGFYLLDRVLTTSSGSESLVTSDVNKQIQPPDNLMYDLDPLGNKIAIYDHHQQLIVKNKNDEVLSITQLPGIHYFHWMDNTNTLLYVRKIYGRNEVGILKSQENKVIPLHDIASDNVQIENVFKSTYSQNIFTIYRRENTLYVASYEAIFGWKEKPLTGIIPKDIWLDEKMGVLYLKDMQQKIWKFSNGKLDYDPKGTEQRQQL